MVLEHIVTKDIYDRMNKIIERDLERLESIKKEIVVAKSYGDLSENSTFEFLITEQDNLTSIVRENQKYLINCEVYTQERIVSENLPIYSTFHITVSDIATEIEEKHSRVLIPSIELGIKDAVTISSELGQCFCNSEVGCSIFLEMGEAAVVLTIDKIENCLERSVMFDR